MIVMLVPTVTNSLLKIIKLALAVRVLALAVRGLVIMSQQMINKMIHSLHLMKYQHMINKD